MRVVPEPPDADHGLTSASRASRAEKPALPRPDSRPREPGAGKRLSFYAAKIAGTCRDRCRKPERGLQPRKELCGGDAQPPQSAGQRGKFHEDSVRVRLEACCQRGQADTPAEGTGVSEQVAVERSQGSPPRLRTSRHSPGHVARRGVHGRRGCRRDGMARPGFWDT